MVSAKKKPPTGASELLRAAVLDMCLYSSFQSIFLGKLACSPSASIRIQRSQADSKAPAVDLKGQPVLFVIVGLPAQIGMI